MTYSTVFTSDGAGVIREAAGVVTGAELIEGALEDHRIPERTRSLRYGLVDLTAVTDLQITQEDIGAIALDNAITASMIVTAAVAVVAPRDHRYGLARMWEARVAGLGWRTGVFRTRSAAVEWLRRALPDLGSSPELTLTPGQVVE